MGLSVNTSAAITYSPPAALTSRALATFAAASFMGSARQKRRMPLRASAAYASDMNSGLAVSQEMNRKPVPMNCSGVLGVAAAIRRMRSHGSSRLKRTATPMCVEVVKSMALKPTRSMTGAILSVRAVSMPTAPHRHWLPSRSEVSTSCTSAMNHRPRVHRTASQQAREVTRVDPAHHEFGIRQYFGMQREVGRHTFDARHRDGG